jgi:hypothetical protein
VKAALDEMVVSTDKSLVRLLRKKTQKLSPKEITDSIKRLIIRIESPATPRPIVISPRPPRLVKKKGKSTYHGVTLSSIINDGLLVPPVKLYRKYKKQMMEATLLADGSIEFRGTTYSNPTTAGEAARAVVTGKKMNTNGWCFWQTRDDSGKLHELTKARACYLAKHPPGGIA